MKSFSKKPFNETKQRGERHLRKIQNFYKILVFFDVCALIYDF